MNDKYLKWLDKQIDTEWDKVLKLKKRSDAGIFYSKEDMKTAIGFHVAFSQARKAYIELKSAE
jgi:hypothetical protein